jgi:hypothetical protein
MRSIPTKLKLGLHGRTNGRPKESAANCRLPGLDLRVPKDRCVFYWTSMSTPLWRRSGAVWASMSSVSTRYSKTVSMTNPVYAQGVQASYLHYRGLGGLHLRTPSTTFSSPSTQTIILIGL